MTKRIDALVNLIDKCQTLADVGCDHGYIGVNALLNDKAKNVIFSDISELSLNKAKIQCKNNNLTNVSFCVYDGLPETKADTVLIAGMGGLQIIKILKSAQYYPKNLILQPMQDAPKVREFVAKNYKFIKDEIIFDKKYYNMLSLKLSNCPEILSEVELVLGKTNIIEKSNDFLMYVKKEKQTCLKILHSKPNDKISHYLSILSTI